MVHAEGDREDLYQLGRKLQMEIDDLLPLVDAARMFGFAETQEGDLVLSEDGERFARAGVLEEKQIFREKALERVQTLRKIVHNLENAPGHVLPKEYFLEPLKEYFSEDEAWAQLETAINWGRYAELFSYQEERGIFRLEEAEAVEAV